MSHIKYQTGVSERERWSIDRDKMKRCIVNKCPYISFGTCLKPKCLLFPERKLKVMKS